MGGKNIENRLLPTSRMGPFRWTEKRQHQVWLDARGVDDKKIAAIVGLQNDTVRHNRLYPEYRLRLEELRKEAFDEMEPMWRRLQMAGGDAMAQALAKAVELLEFTDSDGRTVPSVQLAAIQRVEGLSKLLFAKLATADDEGRGTTNFYRATINLHKSAEGETIIEYNPDSVGEGELVP